MRPKSTTIPIWRIVPRKPRHLGPTNAPNQRDQRGRKNNRGHGPGTGPCKTHRVLIERRQVGKPAARRPRMSPGEKIPGREGGGPRAVWRERTTGNGYPRTCCPRPGTALRQHSSRLPLLPHSGLKLATVGSRTTENTGPAWIETRKFRHDGNHTLLACTECHNDAVTSKLTSMYSCRKSNRRNCHAVQRRGGKQGAARADCEDCHDTTKNTLTIVSTARDQLTGRGSKGPNRRRPWTSGTAID